MPDTSPSRRDRKLPQAERAESADKPTGPLFARAVHVFYDPIFDIRSRAAFQTALNEYVVLPPDERAFHETHLLFRVVQGLESIHGLLTVPARPTSQARSGPPPAVCPRRPHLRRRGENHVEAQPPW